MKAAVETLGRDIEEMRGKLPAPLGKSDPLLLAGGCVPEPTIVHEYPLPPPPLIHPETLRVLVPRAGIGLSVGVVLTAPLAYLLELLFPRKSPGLPGGT